MNEPQPNRQIPRPDVSVAYIILLILSKEGRATFSQIAKHPQVRLLGAIRSENSFYTALARLKRRRLLIRSGEYYELTPSGEYASLKAYVRKEISESEKKESISDKRQVKMWDGRWRMVFFDFPEQKRPLRDYFRTLLKRLGFQEFQRSIWITPKKIPTFVLKFVADPQMRKYAKIITTSDVDYDDDLRKRFKLL